MKMYGPYIRKSENRRYVAFKTGDTRTTRKVTTKLYSRYLMEQHLGRELTSEETVDHINNDKMDDRIENLQILSRADNARKSIKRVESIILVCPSCTKEFSRKPNAYRRSIKLNRKMYCSRKCSRI